MSAPAPDPIRAESLGRLHPRALDDPGAIRELLLRLWRERVLLRRGTNREGDPELARIERIEGRALLLATRGFEPRAGEVLFLTAELGGRPYCFAAPRLGEASAGLLRVALPAVVYEAERRDRWRRLAAESPGAPRRVALAAPGRGPARAEVADLCADGLGLRVPAVQAPAPGASVALTFLDGARRGERARAEVRSVRPAARPGWKRIGLCLVPGVPRGELPIERRELPGPAPVVPGALAEAPRVVTYPGRGGEPIRALLDSVGDPRGAPAVIIPPSWGKTKETLLPLAAAILATFARAGEPVSVVRFDGVRRRGESYNDPECRAPGRENQHYTFSQGAADIQAALDFLEASPELRPQTSILVTFSIAAFEGRRAVLLEPRGRLGGWISVVGSADPQALIRVISGVDYFAGFERGARFGAQDVQGLLLDVDRCIEDALAHGLAFLADARRDLARIEVPISWIHGRFDAWTDLARCRDALSFGATSRRRLIEVPTGHQLRSSAEARGVFGLVASEAARLALGRELEPGAVDPERLRRRRRAEQRRRPAPAVDVRGFWRDYLVGRERTLGMELVTHTEPHRELMRTQLRALGLRSGERVVDLGSGVGAFPAELARAPGRPERLALVELDFVREGLARARERLHGAALPPGWHVAWLAADLDARGLPLRAGSADAALASLVLNYLRDPLALLRGARELLRPGGRIVVSSLRRDADTSRLCVASVAELRSGGARAAFGGDGERALGRALAGFIADAGRLLDLEERGVFHFWDAGELVALLEAAGFGDVRVEPAFGDPPQALVARGVRRGRGSSQVAELGANPHP
jgi:SAM-dependent methyltransferase